MQRGNPTGTFASTNTVITSLSPMSNEDQVANPFLDNHHAEYVGPQIADLAQGESPASRNVQPNRQAKSSQPVSSVGSQYGQADMLRIEDQQRTHLSTEQSHEKLTEAEKNIKLLQSLSPLSPGPSSLPQSHNVSPCPIEVQLVQQQDYDGKQVASNEADRQSMKRSLIKTELQRLESTFKYARQNIVSAMSEDSRVMSAGAEESKDESGPLRALSLPMGQNSNNLVVGDLQDELVSSKRTGDSLQPSDKKLLLMLEK